jgi:hypothetical protein
MAIFNDGVKMNKKFLITPMEEDAKHLFNIVPSSEFVPEWYRKSPAQMAGTISELSIYNPVSTNATYKKCLPFFDAMTVGYMVYLTADIEVTKKDNGLPYVMWRTERHIITEHALEQWEGLPCPDGYSPYVYKWHNQFNIKLPKNYSSLFISPINRFDLPFLTITGIVDCDMYTGQVHFPFFIKKDFVGIIEKGTPITQIIPIKREYWKKEHGTYDPVNLLLHRNQFLSTIKRSYKKNWWNRKEYK